MTLEELRAVAEIVEKLTNRYRDQEAAHKAALTEIRASFVARAGADEKLIEGYRRQIVSLGAANDRLNDLLRVERLAHQDKVAVLQERLRRVTLVDDDGSEPFDPPGATAKLAPKIGDTVRLVTHPERARVAEHLRTALKWPWIDRWGLVGQTGKVVDAVDGAVAVALDNSAIIAWWPIDCLEVVAEATHDTEAGKAAAESGLLLNGGLDVRKVTT